MDVGLINMNKDNEKNTNIDVVIAERVDYFDKQNRRKDDTEEISYLLDYWRLVKFSQLSAGLEGDSLLVYESYFDKIKVGETRKCLNINKNPILIGDELQRIMDEVNRLRNVNVNTT